MKVLQFLDDGRAVECKTDEPISSAVLAHSLGVPMVCGGHGRCATCHVFVEAGMENLSERTDQEKRTLARITSCSPKSRLSCQARVLGNVSIKLPEGEYVESASSLETMLGKRAKKDILHPIDGRILVKKGQIISRFVLRKLESGG
ncbi:MAG: 2Fe-2S iron-sulfur cluster binding domain-containing protein [Candidatus Sumerlaeia bacterium]|nr:2Fe-2S iron-sulfur cluster binding domain-containing protein [Candidatus Sumerlaeia bacterium]